MHSNSVVSINDVGIRPTPDRVLPTNGSSYRGRSIPDSFVDNREIYGIESIEQGSDATVNQKPRIVNIKCWPIGISNPKIKANNGNRPPHKGGLKSKINNRSSSRKQKRSWRHKI